MEQKILMLNRTNHLLIISMIYINVKQINEIKNFDAEQNKLLIDYITWQIRKLTMK